MISIDFPSHRFQLRAAAVVVDDGHVLLHRMEGDAVWALPGGRVDPGEAAQETVVREMAEELGEPVECGALLYVFENFFPHGARPYHEIGLYFTVRLAAASSLLDKARSHAGVEGDKRLEFKWFAIHALAAIELRPSSLREALLLPGESLRHFVQRD